MRHRMVGLALALFCAFGSLQAAAQVNIGINIGVNVPAYPQLVAVPGYPVYYAPRLNANYFFYDGLYWVFTEDNWYASSWYNGPWRVVAPASVPYYVLQVPVRYYRVPPPYFRGWERSAPPHWGERFGPQWEQQHRGWERREAHNAPPPAPLPTYQRQYSGNRYPHAEQQRQIEARSYRYEPQSGPAREHFGERHGEQRDEAGHEQHDKEGHGKGH